MGVSFPGRWVQVGGWLVWIWFYSLTLPSWTSTRLSLARTTRKTSAKNITNKNKRVIFFYSREFWNNHPWLKMQLISWCNEFYWNQKFWNRQWLAVTWLIFIISTMAAWKSVKLLRLAKVSLINQKCLVSNNCKWDFSKVQDHFLRKTKVNSTWWQIQNFLNKWINDGRFIDRLKF